MSVLADPAARITAALALTAVEGGLGVEVTTHEPGRVTLEALLDESGVGVDGHLDPVLLGVLADAATGTAVLAGADRAYGGVTASLRVDRVRPLTRTTGRVVAVARTETVGPDGGVAVAEVHDPAGMLVATARATLARVADGPVAVPDADEPAGPAPRLRLPVDALDPVPDGTAVIRPDPRLRNTRGATHGGVVLGLVQHHQEQVLRAGGHPHRHRGLEIVYLRPVHGVGVVVRTSAVRVGRRFGLLQSTVSDRAGRVLAVGSGTVTTADLGEETIPA